VGRCILSWSCRSQTENYAYILYYTRPTSGIAQRSGKPPATPVFHTQRCPLKVCGILASLCTYSLRSRSKYILVMDPACYSRASCNGRAQRSCYIRPKPHKDRSSTAVYASHAWRYSRAPAWSTDMRSAISKPLIC
jgi:hypothetical protein